MKINYIKFRNFKRFTDLEIRDIPESARLVMLIGPNGSGKSSVFEGFSFWRNYFVGSVKDDEYYFKIFIPDIDKKSNRRPSNLDHVIIDFHDETYHEIQKNQRQAHSVFYIRTAYRQQTQFQVEALSALGDMVEEYDIPRRLIDHDDRISKNYQRLVTQTIKEIYAESNRNRLVGDVADILVGELRKSVLRVFHDLKFESPNDPIESQTFHFTKGRVTRFSYKNLSAGEKAAFDLVLDFIIKREGFNNTVYCIDEPDLHMNTRLQGKLLQELYALIPANCQLWIATHSIGMMREAVKLHQSNPGEVTFLDFEGHDFDEQVIIQPAKVDRKLWQRVFAVALDDLADLVAPAQIVFCEGRPPHIKGKGKPFDAEIYNRVFASEFPETQFVSIGGEDMAQNYELLLPVFRRTMPHVKIWGVKDRDDRTDFADKELSEQNIRVLRRRAIENYVWDDEILEKLCLEHDKQEIYPQLLQQKTALIGQAMKEGLPVDDVKSITGQLYIFVKRVLQLVGCGNNTEEFAIATLAPLITPETKVYQELKAEIFGL